MPNLKWAEAFDQCGNYRNFLSEQDIPTTEKSKAYLLTLADIESLLNQGGNKMDGIRIYVGQEIYESGGSAIRLYAVAVQDDGNGNCNDYNIPSVNDVANNITIDTILERGRPCPAKCSNANGLNV